MCLLLRKCRDVAKKWTNCDTYTYTYIYTYTYTYTYTWTFTYTCTCTDTCACACLFLCYCVGNVLFSLVSNCKWWRSNGFFGELLKHVITTRGQILGWRWPPAPRVRVRSKRPVCTGTTRTCWNTCAHGVRTHGDVLNVHTEPFWNPQRFSARFSACRNTHVHTPRPPTEHHDHNDTHHTNTWTPHGDRDRQKQRERDRERETRKDKWREDRKRRRKEDKKREEARQEVRQDEEEREDDREKRKQDEEQIKEWEEKMKSDRGERRDFFKKAFPDPQTRQMN